MECKREKFEKGFQQKSEKRGYFFEEKSEIRVWLSFFGDKHENKHLLKCSRRARHQLNFLLLDALLFKKKHELLALFVLA